MVDRLSNSMNNDLGQGNLNESFASMQNVYTYSNQNLASIVNMPQTKTSQMLEGFRTMISSSRIYKQIEDKGSRIFTSKGSGSNYSGGYSGSGGGGQSSQLTEDTLQRITIDASEFNQYKTKITNELNVYVQQKRINQESIDVLQTVNLSDELLKCYKNVPSMYFDQNFHFDFKGHLSRDGDEIVSHQDKLITYLEEVDLNLLYQIQTRFNEFLGIIVDLNEMQDMIMESIMKVHRIRSWNAKLKQQLLTKANHIVKTKQKIIKCQSLLALLQLAHTLHKSLPSINNLINNNNFDTAVNLLHHAQTQYNSKFQNVVAFNPLRDSIFINRSKLEKNISMSFMDKSLDYVISELNFIKQPYLHGSHAIKGGNDNVSADNSFDDSSYINSTLIQDTFDTNSNQLMNLTQIMSEAQQTPQLKWQHTIFRRDINLEEQISRIVNQSYDLNKFNNQNYRRKLIELLKGFREGYLIDMQDYIQNDNHALSHNKQILSDINGSSIGNSQNNSIANNNSNANNNNDKQQLMFESMNIDLFLKFVMFYQEILRRVALKQMGLNNSLINSLVNHVINQLLQKQNDLDDNINAFSQLTSCVDDIYQNVIQLFKYINDWVDHLISQKKLDNEVSFAHFRKINKVLTFWDDFFLNQVPQFFKISNTAFENNQKCKDSKEFRKFFRKFNEYHTKISMKSLEVIRVDMEKKFLDQFHKKQLKDFKEILNNEKWIPVDIHFEYYDIITYIISKQNNDDHNKQLRKSSLDDDDDEDKILENMNNPDAILENDNQNQEENKQNNENPNEITTVQIKQEQQKLRTGDLRIKKNQLTYKEKTYKLTNGFMNFIKMIYEYVHLIQYFTTMRDSCCKKLFELLRFYNTYANELIIGCGAFNFGVQITARNIAMSSLCLLFVIHILPELKEKLKFIINKNNNDNNNNHELNESIEYQCNRLLDEYKNHNESIFNTIADILNKEIQTNATILQTLKWNLSKENIKNPTPQTLSILKSYRQMYNVLVEFYDLSYISLIYTQPLDHLLNTYLPAFVQVQITNKLGAKRIKDEIEYSVDDIKNQEYIKLNQNLFKTFEDKAEDIIHDKCMPHIQATQNNNDNE